MRDMTSHLGLDSSALGVVSLTQGIVAGDGEVSYLPQYGGTDQWGIRRYCLVPILSKVASIKTKAKWMIIVESHAALNALLEAGLCSLHGSGILVTGRGKPGPGVRAFIARLAVENPAMRIFVIVDFDPAGMLIGQAYKELLPERIEFMGMTAPDASSLSAAGRLKLSKKAHDKAQGTLQKNLVCSSIRLQLRFILQAGFKAELDALAIPRQRNDWSWQADEDVKTSNALVTMVTERLAFAMGRTICAVEASIGQATAALLASPGLAWSRSLELE